MADFKEVMELIGKGKPKKNPFPPFRPGPEPEPSRSISLTHPIFQTTGQFQGYEKMVTSRVALEDVVEKGFEELVNNRDDQIKILISPKLRSSQA
jgi:hypothetical protein